MLSVVLDVETSIPLLPLLLPPILLGVSVDEVDSLLLPTRDPLVDSVVEASVLVLDLLLESGLRLVGSVGSS